MTTGKKMVLALILMTGRMTGTAQTDTLIYNKNVPFRVSIVPGLSSPGKADPYTTSNFSLNIYGGITGSVNGVEIGSLFNIDKNNVQYAQVAGLFNMVGGYFNGAQASGLFNTVGKQLNGVQAAGLTNYVGTSVRGIQVSGIHNFAGGKLTGIQVAGIGNYARQASKGIQIAGISNISASGATGIQISGLVNYAKHLKGLQIGVINIADTSEGYAIGLFNFVAKGYHKVSVYADEILNLNIAYRSGNARLYSILLAGIHAGSDNKVFSYGYGLGHEIAIGNKFSINPEITSQYMYLGNWHYLNLLNKAHMVFNYKPVKGIAVFVAPSFAAYYTEQTTAVHGYKFSLPSSSYNTFRLWNDEWKGWVGWSAGITFF